MIQLVCRFASRMAFSMYSVRRSTSAVGAAASIATPGGQHPTSTCRKRHSSLRSGAQVPCSSVRAGAAARSARPSVSRQSSAISDKALMRARTSSPSFVSCVDSVVISAGQQR